MPFFMQRIATLLLLLVVSLAAMAQLPTKPVGGRGAAMGMAHAALTDPWAAMSNQAALGWDSVFWVGAHYESRYLLKELGQSEVAGIIPLYPGSMGISLAHTGYAQMGLTRADLTYGMRLGAKLSAGIGFGFCMANFTGEYKNRYAFTVSAGVQYQPLKKLLVGAHLFNPARASLDDRQTMPAALAIGLAFLPSKEFALTIQADASTETRTAVRAGMEYRPIDAFAVRLGYGTQNPEGLTAGIGLNISGFIFDMAVGYHQVLGLTPAVSAAYRFK